MGECFLNSQENRRGKVMWGWFTNVVFLKEQMRQVDDPSYLRLLRKMREGLTDLDDYIQLVQSCMGSPEPTVDVFAPMLARKCIVRENKIRHCVNMMQIVNFALRNSQKIVAFLASHPNLPSHMTAADAWSIMDASSTCTSPGIFWYTERMPVIITRNIHVSLGKEDIAFGFVTDPASKVYEIESHGHCKFYIVDRPPSSLLVQVNEPKHGSLEGLPPDVFPIYPSMSRVTLPAKGRARPDVGFRRIQVPCTSGFAITDYRSQGRTYEKISVDFTTNARNLSDHKMFCSLYVALSRCKSESGVTLLAPLSSRQFFARPSDLLHQEVQRLQVLAEHTERMSCCTRPPHGM